VVVLIKSQTVMMASGIPGYSVQLSFLRGRLWYAMAERAIPTLLCTE